VPGVYAGNAARATPGNPEFEGVMQALDELRDRVVADGAHFLVLLMPTKEEVYLPPLGIAVPDAMAAFQAALDARAMPFLDLTPAFAARAGAGESLFFEVDIHPNPAGNRLIAETVLDELRRHAQRYGLDPPDAGS
jgi:hypothetical protein